MPLDRLLYRLLTGSWGRFAFQRDPVAIEVESVPDPVGVYVHIPFCRSICPFCPYNKMLYEPESAARYSRCLQAEAETVLARLGNVKVSSVYFGGGTPLTLPEAIDPLLDLMRPCLAQNAQVAVEAHPDDVTPQMASRLADAGINMVSLGFSINVDLITGIPGQSLDSATSDMLRLVRRGVDQVSAYPLMDFPFTHMRSRLSLRGQRRLLDALGSIGSQHGYERSSVWTWTKPGSPKYTSITREDYVGIGAGAASHLGHSFWLNTFSVEAYMDAINGAAGTRSAVALSAVLRERESALYRLFWRCYEGGFDLRSPEAQAIPILRRLVGTAERLGLVRSLSSTVRLTDRGLFLYHLLERYYTRRYIGRLWQSCRESAFPAGMEL